MSKLPISTVLVCVVLATCYMMFNMMQLLVSISSYAR